MASIQRKLEVNEKLYQFLLEKRANTSIARSGIIPQTKIIEKARNIGIIGSSKDKSMLIFIGLGIFISYL